MVKLNIKDKTLLSQSMESYCCYKVGCYTFCDSIYDLAMKSGGFLKVISTAYILSVHAFHDMLMKPIYSNIDM